MNELTCVNCGLTFGVTEGFEQVRRADHREFWCPNGHAQHFAAETEADRYRRMYEEAQSGRNVLRVEYESLKRSAAKAKKELKSLKKRAAAGVCPCCTRTVSQLAEHMKTKHPEYRELAGLNPVKLLPEKTESTK